MTIEIGPASRLDVERVHGLLRADDVAEMEAHGHTPETVLAAMLQSLDGPALYAAYLPGTRDAFVIFGLGENGYVWALATDEVKAHRAGFIRRCPDAASLCAERAGVPLWTVAWRGNPLHLRWLAWCGFIEIGEETPGFPIMVRPDNV